MEKNKLQWKRIAKGEKLPCQSFLRKKNGEILKLSTSAGIEVGQDAYYLPVDDVIEEIKNYPIEESEDEKIRNGIIQYLEQSQFGEEHYQIDDDIVRDYIAWLERQGEQKPAEWSEEDRECMKSLLDILNGTRALTPSEIECHKDWFKSLKDRVQHQSHWKPSDKQIEAVRIAAEIGTANNSWAMGILKSMYQDLKKLKG